MSTETSKQNISSKVQGILDKLKANSSSLLSKPTVSFGKTYFAQTEVLNLPTTGEDVISGYKDLNLKAALEENDELKKLIDSLKEDFSSLIPILLGVGGMLAVLPSAKAEELISEMTSEDLSNLTEDDLNEMIKMVPQVDETQDAVPSTPSEDAVKVPTTLTTPDAKFLSDVISLGESNSDYEITFGGDDYLSPQEFSGGKRLTEMSLAEVMAFQDKRNSIEGNTGAMGKYQFIAPTLKWLVGISKLDPNTTKFTPDVQEYLQSLFLNSNIQRLKQLGIEITPANLSLAHYVGADGLNAVKTAIKNGEGDLSVADVIFKYTGQNVYEKNPELVETTAEEFEMMQTEKLKRKAKEKGIELPPGYFQQPVDLQIEEPPAKSSIIEGESLNPENLVEPDQKGSQISRSSQEIEQQEDQDETIVVPTASNEQPPSSNPIVQNTPANAPRNSTSADALHLDYTNYFAVA